VVRTGETFAEQVLALRHSDPGRFPEKFVNTYRIR